MHPAFEERMSPEFEELLRGFDIDEMERYEGAAFGLTSDLVIGYVNPAWFQFAHANGAAGMSSRSYLGESVLASVGGSLRPFFEQHYRRCLADQRPWSHDYACSSAELYRSFHTNVYPIAEGRGLLVVNALVVEAPHDAETQLSAQPPITDRYLREDGAMLQCMHCRRMQRADKSAQWDWVPAFVEQIPENMTGGLCKPCYRVHYPSAPAMP